MFDDMDEDALMAQAMSLSLRNADSVLAPNDQDGSTSDGAAVGCGGDGGEGENAEWPFQASLASKIAEANRRRLCDELASRRGSSYARILHVDAKIHPVLGLASTAN